MDHSDFVIGKRTLVGTVADANGNALEPFLNSGSAIQIEDLDLLDLPGLDPIHTRDNPLCRYVIRCKHGNIPGAVRKAGRRTDGAPLVCQGHELFKIQLKGVDRFLYPEVRLNRWMDFT